MRTHIIAFFLLALNAGSQGTPVCDGGAAYHRPGGCIVNQPTDDVALERMEGKNDEVGETGDHAAGKRYECITQTGVYIYMEYVHSTPAFTSLVSRLSLACIVLTFNPACAKVWGAYITYAYPYVRTVQCVAPHFLT